MNITDLYLHMWIVVYVFYFITGQYLVPVLWRCDSHTTLLTHCASSVFPSAVGWTATPLRLTRRETGRLDKGNRRCLAQRYSTQTRRRNVFLFFLPAVPPSHSPVCFFAIRRRNVPLHDAPSQVTDLTLQLSLHQEILELPEHSSPRWNTTPTSRRKWRRNFRNSCNMAFTVNIFRATFAQSILYIYCMDYVNVLFKINNKRRWCTKPIK